MCKSTVSGANTDIKVTFEEKTEDPSVEGLFTVNVSWTHPNGMYNYLHTPVCLTDKLKLYLMLLSHSFLYVSMCLLWHPQMYCIIQLVSDISWSDVNVFRIHVVLHVCHGSP